MDAFTKRNHYNPCFWTALWNVSYFESRREGRPDGSSRSQHVFALSALANKVYPTTIEKVHFQQDLGVAEITPAAMKDFARRRFPNEYADVAKYLDNHPESAYLDFEDILTGIERIGYDSLLEAATLGDFSSTEHKGFLTCLIAVHSMRSYEMMTAMLQSADSVGLSKWEYFWLLKNAWSSQSALGRATLPLACARWTLYRTEAHRFPLCDSPIMIEQDSVLAVLSPRLLVEIDLRVASTEDKWVVRDGISFSKYREFRRRSIGNTFREIIFHDRDELTNWRETREFKDRVRVLKGPTALLTVASAATRVVWGWNGYGRVPAEFESWAEERASAENVNPHYHVPRSK